MRLRDFCRKVFFVVLIMMFSIGVTSCSSEQSANQAVKTGPGHAVDQETVTRNVYENELARTPPMGWNSWNCFHKDINEVQIKQIADAMVDSGMRDAGYEYLDLDVRGVKCLLLVLEGRNVLGSLANARVISTEPDTEACG